MSNWNVFVLNVDGITWDADGTVPRPNADLAEEITSTQQQNILANGDTAYIAPETKSMKQPLEIVWLYQDITFKNKIKAYIENYDYLKIVTHVAGEEYIGRFANFRPVRLIGVEPDTYDISVTFEIMEGS